MTNGASPYLPVTPWALISFRLKARCPRMPVSAAGSEAGSIGSVTFTSWSCASPSMCSGGALAGSQTRLTSTSIVPPGANESQVRAADGGRRSRTSGPSLVPSRCRLP